MLKSFSTAGVLMMFSLQAAAQSPELLVNERVLMGDSGSVELRLTVLGVPGQAYAVAWSPSPGPTWLGFIELHLGSDYEMVGTGFLDGNGSATVVWTPPSGEESVCLQGATASDMRFTDFVLTNPVILPVVGAPGTVGTVDLADSSVTKAKVSFNYAGSNSKGGKATDAELLDGLEASSFAHALHGHDDRYFTESELAASGGGAAVHWNNLAGLPTSTKGDLLVEDGADVVALPVGADGQVLMADSTQPAGLGWIHAALACPPAPALVPKTGQETSYAAGDDGDLEKGVTWPNPRFTDNSDGTVTDNLTGLIWLKNANCFGAKSWLGALSDANGLADPNCGLTDGSVSGNWRLPNRFELESLLDLQFYSPALSNAAGTSKWTEGDPFSGLGLGNQIYWSSSAVAFDTFWYIELYYGSVSYTSQGQANVWPVRGGQ